MSLPQEIINLIIEALSSDFYSLQTLCLVSKNFLPDAQKHLYRRIEIVNCEAEHSGLLKCGLGPWEISFAAGYQFLLTIVKRNPILPPYVQRFAYSANVRGRMQPPYHFWKLLMRALELMVNLKCLCLENVALDEHPVANILEKSCSFQLTEFQWGDHSRRARPDQFHTILRFLSSQPHLKYLGLPTRQPYEIIEFPDANCQGLDALVGSGRTLAKILPGRSITKVVWWASSHDPVPPLFGHLHAELSLLETLVLKPRTQQQHQLQTLAPHLRSLKTFHLHGETTSHNELEYLAILPKLRTFIWSLPPISNGTRFTSVETQKPLVVRWFSMVKTLETICFQYSSLERGQGPECRQWSRGGNDPVDTNWQEVIGWYGWGGAYNWRYYNTYWMQ